jgi:hypothetical protein
MAGQSLCYGHSHIGDLESKRLGNFQQVLETGNSGRPITEGRQDYSEVCVCPRKGFVLAQERLNIRSLGMGAADDPIGYAVASEGASAGRAKGKARTTSERGQHICRAMLSVTPIPYIPPLISA